MLWRHRKKISTGVKKLIYESFIRSHLLYCLPVWGGAAPNILKPLNRSISKAWKRIGRYKMHTLNRLKEYRILKLEDEVELQETKLIWKWEKNKLPSSLRNIIVERQNNLRNRSFVIPRNSKNCSINSRLAKRASKVIHSISQFRTKRTLLKHTKQSILDNKYSFQCSRRNCYICRN